MRRLALAAVALLALWPDSAPVRAEIVHLKGGSKIEGRIVEQTDAEIRIEIKAGDGTAVMTIKRARIDRIEESATFEDRIKAAQARLDAGDARAAESQYRELVRENPRHSVARMGLAKALYAAFKYAEAIKTLENYVLLVQQGRDPELLLLLADYYLQDGNYKEAKRAAREAADLYPEDKSLALRAEEFLKRIERVRTGVEQIKQRETAEQAELKKRVEERRTWDKKRGTCLDAVRAADALEAWTAESAPKLLFNTMVELGAQDEVIAAYNQGCTDADWQGRVTRVGVTFTVDEVRWTEMYDNEKATLIYGWYHQMRARYGKAYPVVTVECTVKEDGKEKSKNLARGSWDGRRNTVVVDRWTRENRDPAKPKPKVIK